MKNNVKNMLIGGLIGIIVVLIVFIILVVNGTISFSLRSDNELDEKENNISKNIKLDDMKEYVYDANYSYNNQHVEYSNVESQYSGNSTEIDANGIIIKYNAGTQHLSDLKVPYININTKDASDTNKTLEELYLDVAQDFDEFAVMEDPYRVYCQILTYKVYQYDNILSIVVIYGVGKQFATPWSLQYYTYNFDLNTGNLLKYNEVVSRLGYNSSDLLKKVEVKVKDKMNLLWGDRYNGDLSNACYDGVKEVYTNCYDIALQNINYAIEKNSIRIFVDIKGDLNMYFVPGYTGSQNGFDTYLIKIEK